MRSTQNWTYSLGASLLLLAPFDLLASLGMDVYLPTVPRMPVALDTTPDVIQLSLSLYLFVLGSGQLLFGVLSDRLGRRPILLGGAVLFTGSSMVAAMTSTASVFVAFRVLQATGAAATLVATFATVRDVYASRNEGTLVYGLLGSMLAFVPALGPILGAAVDLAFGWRAIFGLLASLGFLAGIGAFLCWPETRPEKCSAAGLGHIREILVDAPFWIYTFGFSAAAGAFFVYFSTAARVLIDRIGLTPLVFSVLFATVAVVMIVTSRMSVHAVARWGERGCLLRGMTLLLAGAMMLAIGQLLSYPTIWGFVGPMWLIAVGIAATCAVTASGALRPFGHAAGTASAIYSCAESVIGCGGGTLAVLALPADTAWPLITFCTISALITLSLARNFRADIGD